MSAHRNALLPWIEHLRNEINGSAREKHADRSRLTSDFDENSRGMSNDGIFILIGKCVTNVSIDEDAVLTKHNFSIEDLNTQFVSLVRIGDTQ